MANGARQEGAETRLTGVWWVIVAVVVLAVVGWGGWLLARPQGGETPTSAARPSGPATSAAWPSATGTPTAAADNDSPDARPSAPGRPRATARPAAAGEGPQGHPDAEPTEHVRLPGLAPAPRRSRWLVARPLPADAMAQGRLVAGYPSTVLPNPRWARVRISSVSSDGITLQATLQAHTSRPGKALLEHYRSALTTRGFGVSESPTIGSQRALRFFRRADSVVVTVDPSHSSYSVFAVLYAAPRR